MASMIHNRSDECTKTELDLFKPPSTQTSLEKSTWVEILPTSAITENGPLEYHVSGSGNDYLDLMNVHLYIRGKIVNSDGSDITQANEMNVAPCNNLLHSMFSQVETSLNGHIVGYSHAYYPYRAIIETLTNYGTDACKSHLQSALFYKDTAGSMDERDPRKANLFELVQGFDLEPSQYVKDEDNEGVVQHLEQFGNNGLHRRWLITRRSQYFEMKGLIHGDIFQQERLLLNGVDLGIKLIRQKPQFYLMSQTTTPDYRLELEKASIFIRKVTVGDHVFLAQQQALLRSNAIYPLSYVALRSYSIPQGNENGPPDNIFLGQIPTHMIIAFVDTDARNGSYEKNPYNFKNMNVQHFVARVCGEQIPAKPITLHYETGDNRNGGREYLRAYQQLFLGTDRMFGDQGIIISRQDFPRGYALYAFDLRADMGCRGHYSLKRTGAVQLDITFREALPRTIDMLVYARFDSYLEITASREVVVPH